MVGREREFNVARLFGLLGFFGATTVLIFAIRYTVAVSIITDKQTVKFKTA